MLERNRIDSQRNYHAQTKTEPRWNPHPERNEEQRDLIKELGQLQITPGGFGF